VLIIELSNEKHALQNIQNDCYEGLSDSCRVHQIRFQPGLRPGPRWGSSRRSPRPPSPLGRGTPLSHSPPPLDAFGVSVSSPAATRPRPKTPSEFFFWIRPREGSRHQGRPIRQWIHDIEEWTGCEYIQLKEMSQDRAQWRRYQSGHLLSPTLIKEGRLVSEWVRAPLQNSKSTPSAGALNIQWWESFANLALYLENGRG